MGKFKFNGEGREDVLNQTPVLGGGKSGFLPICSPKLSVDSLMLCLNLALLGSVGHGGTHCPSSLVLCCPFFSDCPFSLASQVFPGAISGPAC